MKAQESSGDLLLRIMRSELLNAYLVAALFSDGPDGSVAYSVFGFPPLQAVRSNLPLSIPVVASMRSGSLSTVLQKYRTRLPLPLREG